MHHVNRGVHGPRRPPRRADRGRAHVRAAPVRLPMGPGQSTHPHVLLPSGLPRPAWEASLSIHLLVNATPPHHTRAITTWQCGQDFRWLRSNFHSTGNQAFSEGQISRISTFHTFPDLQISRISTFTTPSRTLKFPKINSRNGPGQAGPNLDASLHLPRYLAGRHPCLRPSAFATRVTGEVQFVSHFGAVC